MRIIILLFLCSIGAIMVQAGLENDVKSVTAWIGGLSRDIDKFVGDVSDDALDDIEGLARDVRDQLEGVIKDVWQKVDDEAHNIHNDVMSTIDSVKNEASNLHNDVVGAVDKIENVPKLVIQEFFNIFGKIDNFLKDIIEDVSQGDKLQKGHILLLSKFLKDLASVTMNSINMIEKVILSLMKDAECFIVHVGNISIDKLAELASCLGDLRNIQYGKDDLLVWITDISSIGNALLDSVDDTVKIMKEFKLISVVDTALTVVGAPVSVGLLNSVSLVETSVYAFKILIRVIVTTVDVIRNREFFGKLKHSEIVNKIEL